MTELQRDPDERRAEPLLALGQLTVRSERADRIHAIRLFGELDLATAVTAERELARVEATDAETILLDLSGLTFVDSTGVRLLVTATARSRADQNRLALVRGPYAVQRVLELCGVVERLPFAE
jgi:anti-sigma B factor antagonist